MEGILKYLVNVLKVIGVFFCLYCFICSLDILSTSFKLLAGEETGKIFQHDILQNPVIGLMIGILGTVLVQSSSTFSSIIVAGIGSGMVKISIAVPMIMGANIGTSVTNTLVAMTQVGNPEEFERAFSAATVHDMFNWSAVILLFTVESVSKKMFGKGFLEMMTGSIADKLVTSGGSGAKIKVMSYITDPVTKSIIKIDKKVLEKWAEYNSTCVIDKKCQDCSSFVNETTEPCRLLHSDESSGFLFNLPDLSDQAIGGILLGLSLLVLVGSLMVMVKILNSLLQGSMAENVKKIVNPKFKSSIVQYLFGYVLILVGTGATIVLQSSSIFTSTLTPMVGMGYVEVETCYPMFLGSNIGTTFTSMLAALTQSESKSFKDTVQGALIHMFFNIIGILLFYPIPFMRIPIPLCKKLGKITAKYRWFALVYIIGMFFVMPGVFVALTLIDSSGIVMNIFLGIFAVVLAVIGTINFMQSNATLQKFLPKILLNWDFMPKPLRSLEPYDRCLTSLPCCRKCAAPPEENVVLLDALQSGSTFTMATMASNMDLTREEGGIANPGLRVDEEEDSKPRCMQPTATYSIQA